MALTKKHCLKLMLSKGGKYYFREPIVQNLAESPLAARALGTPPSPLHFPPPPLPINLTLLRHCTAEKICGKVIFYLIIFFNDQKRVTTSSVTWSECFECFRSFLKYFFFVLNWQVFAVFLNNSLYCRVLSLSNYYCLLDAEPYKRSLKVA